MWTCKNCGEASQEMFTRCVKCGTDRDTSEEYGGSTSPRLQTPAFNKSRNPEKSFILLLRTIAKLILVLSIIGGAVVFFGANGDFRATAFAIAVVAVWQGFIAYLLFTAIALIAETLIAIRDKLPDKESS